MVKRPKGIQQEANKLRLRGKVVSGDRPHAREKTHSTHTLIGFRVSYHIGEGIYLNVQVKSKSFKNQRIGVRWLSLPCINRRNRYDFEMEPPIPILASLNHMRRRD